jgi:hypothetical protein
MRRWVRTGVIVSHFVEFNGAAVKSVKSGVRSAVGIAKLSKVAPHTLRYTAATWLMQRGADPWKAAVSLGMSVEVLLDTYGYHHREFLREAVAVIKTKPSKNIGSGVDPGVDLAAYRERRTGEIMVGVAGFEPATPASRARLSRRIALKSLASWLHTTSGISIRSRRSRGYPGVGTSCRI